MKSIDHVIRVNSATSRCLTLPSSKTETCSLAEAHGKAIDKSVFPGKPGRPARTRHRREGRVLQGSARPVVQETTRAASSSTPAPSPNSLASCGFQIVSGGTDNHLMLVDLRSRGLTGKVAQIALDEAAITVNKNTVPKETQSPFVTSGIRVGTSAVTTRGMGEREMARIAESHRSRSGRTG